MKDKISPIHFHKNQIMAFYVVHGLMLLSEMSNEEKCVNETTKDQDLGFPKLQLYIHYKN